MFDVGNYVVYRKNVCKIKEINKKKFNNEDYYTLIPVNDTSLKIEIPISNKNGYIRNLITLDEIDELIKKIPEIDIIKENDKLIENEYKKLMLSGTFEDLIKIIKTTYLRNKERLDKNKKVGDRDERYFEEAEMCLYTEFSIVLNKNYNDTKEYIINKVAELTQ